MKPETEPGADPGAEPGASPSDGLEPIQPEVLGPARGWTHGFLGPPGGRVLFVAGQTAAEDDGTVETPDFARQFDRVLEKVLLVVTEAGGHPEQIARLTVYVTDLDAYLAARKEIGGLWKARMGRHYPAMALVEVRRLVDAGALVEMEATAVLPPDAPPDPAAGPAPVPGAPSP
jgi:enamine deaminase RidA (YjgF/YER057c/UK114 family)